METCISCGQSIPDGRLKALPGVKTCVACSTTGKVAGFPVIDGKNSYSALQLVDQDKAQELYKLQDRKGGAVASGVLFKELPPPKLSNFE